MPGVRSVNELPRQSQRSDGCGHGSHHTCFLLQSLSSVRGRPGRHAAEREKGQRSPRRNGQVCLRPEYSSGLSILLRGVTRSQCTQVLCQTWVSDPPLGPPHQGQGQTLRVPLEPSAMGRPPELTWRIHQGGEAPSRPRSQQKIGHNTHMHACGTRTHAHAHSQQMLPQTQMSCRHITLAHAITLTRTQTKGHQILAWTHSEWQRGSEWLLYPNVKRFICSHPLTHQKNDHADH